MKKTLITLLGIVLFGAAVAVEKPAGATMEQYVDALMRRMTLEEKIGQLNLPSAGDITTGQAKSSDIAEKIRRGEVGGLFNIKGVEKIRDVQRIAVEESRLGHHGIEPGVLKELEEHRDKLQEYDCHLETLQERNSYSKTDKDATFMRMKEDAMRNGQTKPGYNLQIGTENQFITDFALFPNPTDTLTLIPFLQSFSNRYDRMAHTVVADSGYGSEENYRFMSENGMEAYVKYNYFHMKQRPRFKPDPFKAENFYYNEEHDFCICPMGQRMRRIGTRNVKTASGYVSENARYRAVRCEGCPLRCRCFKAKGNRTIELNHRLRQYKRRAKELLCSEKGLKHRGQRCIEPEAVFGQIKNNMNYKRFRHLGKDKVFMDFAFLAIAFNIKKMCAKLTKEGMNWLIRLFYKLTTAVFRCWEHINQRNLQKIAA